MSLRALAHMLAVVVATCAFAAGVQGSIITYTISGVGSGTVGSTSFTDQSFSIVLTADTATVQATGGGQFAVNNNALVVQVGASTYTGTFAGSSYITIPSVTTIPPGFGYSQANFGDFIDTFNFAVGSFDFTGYDLQTSLGPVPAVAFTAYTGPFFGFLTSGGFFSLNSQTSSPDMTFQATVDAAVPEPSMLVVATFLSGSGGAMVWQRRLRERQAA